MKKPFNNRFRKLVLFLLLGFIALFVFRLAYGFTKTIDEPSLRSSFFTSGSSFKKNYASKEYQVRSTNKTQVSIDQKYEKIAEISTKSTAFEAEETQVRQQIKNHDALIQFEQKSGNKGNQKLNLLIGVPPENFDALYQQLIAIGKVQAKQITKKDKTNEYKELNAKKASLEKVRTSLIDLKAKSGKIEEYVQLVNRILEIEQQLQELGVSLGDFDDENEFCTVQFSLLEGKETSISLLHRIKVALEWTIKYYLGIMATLFFLTFFANLLLLVIEKLKIIDHLMRKE